MSPRLGYGPRMPLVTRPASPKLAMDSAPSYAKPPKQRLAQDNPLLLLGALGGGALNAAASGINGSGSPLHFAADVDPDQDEVIEKAAAWLRERLDPDAIVKLVDALQKTGGEPTAMDSRLRSTSGFESRFPEAARIRIMD